MDSGGDRQLSDSTRADALRERITLLIDLHKYAQAVRAAERALAASPSDPEAYRLLVAALLELGKLAQARAAAEEALRLDPQSADIHSTLAIVLHRVGGHWEAGEHHERAVSLAPETALFHTRYAAFLLDVCRFSLQASAESRAAWEHIETALRLEPENVTAYLLAAEALRRRRRFAEAEASVRRALTLAPEQRRAHEMLGDLYDERGRTAEAFACYREALRIDPRDEPLKRKLIVALEARVPLFGTFWRLGLYTGWQYRVLWICLTALIAFVYVQAGRQVGFHHAQVIIYGGTFAFLILLWGAFLWVIDPRVTAAVIRGWISLD